MDREELIDALKDIINHAEVDPNMDLDDIVYDLNNLLADL